MINPKDVTFSVTVRFEVSVVPLCNIGGDLLIVICWHAKRETFFLLALLVC